MKAQIVLASAAAAASVLPTIARFVRAESYPTGTIHPVVPFPLVLTVRCFFWNWEGRTP
jgi:hypothetical protein